PVRPLGRKVEGPSETFPGFRVPATAPAGEPAGAAPASVLAGGLALGHLLREEVHHGRVAQGGHVAERAALGHVAQEAAHDLARAGLGQVVGPDDPLGPGELADALGDVLADLGLEALVALE